MMGPCRFTRVVVAACGALWGCGLTAVGALDPSAIADGGDAEGAARVDGGGPVLDEAGFPLDAGGDVELTCDAAVATDPTNCGTCGHDCAGGACAAGRCTPVDLVVLAGKTVRAVAADGAHIYWSNETDSTIVQASLDGTAPSVLVTGVGASQLAVNATHLFYTTGELRRRSLTSAEDIRILQGVSGCVSLAPDGARALTVNFGTNAIYVVGVDGSAPQTLLTSTDGVFHPWGVAMTATHLYWSNAGRNDPDGSIVRRLLPSGPNEVLYDHKPNPNCLTFDESGRMYWPYADEGTIHRSNADGTSDVTLATGADTATQVAVNAKFIYWNSGNKIVRLAR